MTFRRLVFLMIAAVLIAGFFPLDSFIGSLNRIGKSRSIAGLNSPIFGGAELLVGDIYKGAEEFVKLPVDLIKPVAIRWKLKGYVKDLPLTPEVEKRVISRIESEEFMEHLVPFLFYLKTQYSVPKTRFHTKFDDHLRSQFSASEQIPGFEHSMFQWVPKKEDLAGKNENPSFLTDPRFLAEIVNLYDAVILQSKDSYLRKRPQVDTATLERALPIVRRILENVQKKVKAEGDLADGLREMLEKPEKLETVTYSMIDFVYRQANKAYFMFAQRIYRQVDLKKWMNAELRKEKGGKLWEYLEKARNSRRYSVHIVVDGLQGHLVEALVSQKQDHPFIKKIHNEIRNPGAYKPSEVESTASPDQSHQFLNAWVEKGFSHPDYLPFFKSIYQSNSASIARGGISTTPTISVRNLPIAKTGAAVAGLRSTGIPNFHFVDRKKERAFYFYGNDAILLEDLTRESGLKTVFERMPGILGMNCNAQYDAGSLVSWEALLNLALGEKARDFGDHLCAVELERRAKNEVTLNKFRSSLLSKKDTLSGNSLIGSANRLIQRNLAEKLIEDIAEVEDDGMPQYLLYYNPWPDHFAHFKGPFSDEILSPSGELNRLDYWLRQISRSYQSAGIYDRTLFGMAGDHGLTPVFHLVSPEKEVFERLKNKGIALKIEKISSDEGEGPKMNHPVRPPSMKSLDIVVASTAGGNYMMDFFKDQGAGWAEQPVYRELTNLKTLAGARIDIISEIVASLKDSLDYLAVRDEKFDVGGGKVRLVSYRNGKRIDNWVHRQGDRLYYQMEEADLLELRTLSPYETEKPDLTSYEGLLKKCTEDAQLVNPKTWCNETEWRLLTSFTIRPDSVVQIGHLYDHDRAGTVNLFPKFGVAYNSKVPGRHAGESFHEKDAFVGFWGKPINMGSRRLRSAVNGSLTPTLYEYITRTQAVEGIDGWGYPSLASGLTGK